MLSAQDISAIQQTLSALEYAWNHSDMDAYAACLTDDCDWINIVGMFWHGREDVMKAHSAFHETMFKGVTSQALTTLIKGITPEVALAILTIQMGEFTTPEGRVEKDMRDRMSYVLLKQPDGHWLIRMGHNTTIHPLAEAHNPVK